MGGHSVETTTRAMQPLALIGIHLATRARTAKPQLPDAQIVHGVTMGWQQLVRNQGAVCSRNYNLQLSPTLRLCVPLDSLSRISSRRHALRYHTLGKCWHAYRGVWVAVHKRLHQSGLQRVVYRWCYAALKNKFPSPCWCELCKGATAPGRATLHFHARDSLYNCHWAGRSEYDGAVKEHLQSPDLLGRSALETAGTIATSGGHSNSRRKHPEMTEKYVVASMQS